VKLNTTTPTARANEWRRSSWRGVRLLAMAWYHPEPLSNRVAELLRETF